jgi:hypothetical protein
MSITECADHHIGPTPDPTEVSARLGSRDTETPEAAVRTRAG